MHFYTLAWQLISNCSDANFLKKNFKQNPHLEQENQKQKDLFLNQIFTQWSSRRFDNVVSLGIRETVPMYT